MTATDELRGYALSVRNIALRTTSLCHEARRDLLDSAVRMEQAADTVESLMDRLQHIPAELDCIEDKSRWFQLFGTPERAARTLEMMCDMSPECSFCPLGGRAESICGEGDYDAILGWLKGGNA